MNASFHLAPTGPPAPCGYPGCMLEDFHEGDHLFAEKPRELKIGARYYRCVICQRPTVVYGERIPGSKELCASPNCLLIFCARETVAIPLACPCRQRPYAHDLSVHLELRHESYNPALRHVWPWSLRLSSRIQPSAETEIELRAFA